MQGGANSGPWTRPGARLFDPSAFPGYPLGMDFIMRTRKLALILGVGAASVLGCAGSQPAKQCVVYSHKHRDTATGVVYMQDGKASFREGLARKDIAWMDENGQIYVTFRTGETEKAAHYAGTVITIDYIEDQNFTSAQVQPGIPIVISSEMYKTQFDFNEECTETEAVVGSVALFHAVFPDSIVGDPGEPE